MSVSSALFWADERGLYFCVVRSCFLARQKDKGSKQRAFSAGQFGVTLVPLSGVTVVP